MESLKSKMNFAQFRSAIEQHPASTFLTGSAEILFNLRNLPRIIAEHIQSLSYDEFRTLLLSGHVAMVQPRVFLLYADPHDRFQIVLNYFERERFNELLLSHHITPHNHARSFSTRIISGGYTQWIYESNREADKIFLNIRKQMKCDRGCVYTLKADTYHMVLAPDDRTMTVAIRGSLELSPLPVRCHADYDDKSIAVWRHRILRELNAAVLCHQEDARLGVNVDLF